MTSKSIGAALYAFHQRLEGLEEAGADGAVDHPVVAGQGDGHHRRDRQLIATDDRALLAGAHR
jgi:hypothetical protein